MKDIIQIIDSKFFLLFAGFVLTTVAGGILTFYFQKRNWRRQACIDLYKKKYDDGIKFLDDLSELIGKRLFFLQKLIWAISDKDDERLVRVEKEYFEIVNIWNINYYKNRNKIRLLVNEIVADIFLDYNDDLKLDDPTSLHYKFVITHRKVMNAKMDNSKLKDALTSVEKLNWSCSSFLEKLTTEFSKRAEKLELLDINELKDNFGNKKTNAQQRIY